MPKFTRKDFEIANLGHTRISSPLYDRRHASGGGFITDDMRIMFDYSFEKVRSAIEHDLPVSTIERAGARSQIYFTPAHTKCAVVTCGGLCPGLNDVIRGLVMTLNFSYGVQTIYGIRYGYEGLVPKYGHELVTLTPRFVNNLHTEGGSCLGSSRGPQDPAAMVDRLVELNIDILFVIGGDGTLRGAQAIVAEVEKRGLKISVIGIPKTIDNDLEYMDKSFGFETAFAEAVRAVRCAHSEAQGYPNGVGLVKLMGRESGFISAFAALAESTVNFVLIPEVPFQFEGPNGFLKALEAKLSVHGHAVVVVAEGPDKT